MIHIFVWRDITFDCLCVTSITTVDWSHFTRVQNMISHHQKIGGWLHFGCLILTYSKKSHNIEITQFLFPTQQCLRRPRPSIPNKVWRTLRRPKFFNLCAYVWIGSFLYSYMFSSSKYSVLASLVGIAEYLLNKRNLALLVGELQFWIRHTPSLQSFPIQSDNLSHYSE